MIITQQIFEVLAAFERAGEAGLTSSELDAALKKSGVSVKVSEPEALLRVLCLDGLLEQRNEEGSRVTFITKGGRAALEPFRVRRAVILAAGFGSRMVPVTLDTPKPLVMVNKERMIDGLLEAIEAAGIPEIILIRGYKGEQFDALLERWPAIKFVDNDMYDTANNISSAWIARNELANAYVCEADLLLRNKALIRKYEYASNYLGVPTDYTNDWCFETRGGIITKVMTEGYHVHHMYGISYWTSADAGVLSGCLDEAWRLPDGKALYWDEVALKLYGDRFQVQVRECSFADITEIDTYEELCAIDASWIS